MSKSIPGIVACLLGLAAALPASAATADREDVAAASGVCVPNVSTASLRNSVAGIKNTGTTNVYVSCSMKNDWHGVASGGTGTGTYRTGIRFVNASSTAVEVKCALYPGYSWNGTTVSGGSYPKSLMVPAGTDVFMTWLAATVIGTGGRFANANFSCSLPPNVTMLYVYDVFDEDIGT